MVRTLLSLYLAFSTLTGPLLCCCVMAARSLASSPAPKPDAGDDCPCCQKVKQEQKPAPIPMPCRCRAEQPAAILPTKELLDQSIEHNWLFSTALVDQWVLTVRPTAVSRLEYLQPPSVLSVRDRLSLLSVLTC